MNDYKIRAGITIGDTNGIGCEIILKTFADNRMCEIVTPILYASAKVTGHYKKLVEGGDNLQLNIINKPSEAKRKRLNLICCLNEELKIEPGKATPESGAAALDSLRAATTDLKNGQLDVLITAPINKENIQCEEFNFKGHTEYLSSIFGGDPLMMMCSELMKIGLATTHLPLAEVSRAITQEVVLTHLECLRYSLISNFGVVEPRLAVLALNPHAGDGGLLGSEETDIIAPAIKTAYAEDILAFGPFAADGFFATSAYRNYDAVLAMYHDQGLAPFKALSPEGVNFTAGLPVVRTSPDHGVAYDIAGHGVADPTSFREAVYLARIFL